MPIGVGAALLIGSAVSAGTQVAGAKMQSNAAKNAAKTQAAGNERALAAVQQAQQPYMDTGKRGLQQLQNPAFSQPYTQQFGGPQGSNGVQAFGGAPQQQPQMTLGGIGQVPANPRGAMAQMGPQGPPQGMGAPQGMPGGPMGGGPTVAVRSPRGQVVQVPQGKLQEALANGGQRV